MSNNRPYSTAENLTLGLLGLVALAVILLFSALGWYAHPSTDDICMAAGVREDGLWWHLLNHYMTWSGRYSGNAFYAIYPLLSGGLLGGYQFIALLLLLSLFTATAFLLARLLQRGMNDFPVVVAALLFTAVYVLGLRSPASSLYWMAGSLSYLSANILLLVIGGLMLRLADRQQAKRGVWLTLILLAGLLVLAIGGNETGMLLIAATVAMVALMRLRLGWKGAWPWLLLLLVATVCSALVYFAPGNAVRNSTFPFQHNLMFAIEGSLGMGVWTLLGWLRNPVFIGMTLLTPFLTVLLCRNAQRRLQPGKRHLALLTALTLGLPFLLEFPAWWAMGGWPPPRTVDAIYFAFLAGWLLTVGALTLYLLPPAQAESRPYLRTGGMVAFALSALLMVLAVSINGRFQHAQMDLRYAAPVYDAYMQQRYALIDEARANGKRQLIVPGFDSQFPRSIYFNDIVPLSTDWRNVCYAQYFGLEKIKRKRVAQPPRGERAKPPVPAMPSSPPAAGQGK